MSLGPDAFPGTRKLIEAAHFICVASGAPVPGMYEAAAFRAALGCRVLIVETQVPHHAAWARRVKRYAPRAYYLDLCPIVSGGVH